MDILADEYLRLYDLIPSRKGDAISWEAIVQTPLGIFFDSMSRTPQNPVFHGEGDVLTHTKIVCDALVSHPKYDEIPARQRYELFLAAVLHDIGKITTTRLEDGVWTSPRHSIVGSFMARSLLWRDFGLSGSSEMQNIRETVCALIRYHMLPERVLKNSKPEVALRSVASIGELAPDFNWNLLCVLAEADMLGREAPDIADSIENIRLSEVIAEEIGCIDGPASFGSAYTKRAYFTGKNVLPEHNLFDDTWGEIILLSGLPGTGKDTWIEKNHPNLPVISLDGIRRELNVQHGEAEAKVIQISQERSKEFLRTKSTFVWNATCVTEQQRRKLIHRFEKYGASVSIVFLETSWAEQIRRNAARDAAVPQSIIEDRLDNMLPPMPWEAQKVLWHCI